MISLSNQKVIIRMGVDAMLLIADAGNTSTVFVIYKDDIPVSSFRTVTGDYSAEIFKDIKFDVNAAIISSVVPSVNEKLSSVISEIFKCKVIFLNSELNAGIKVCTDYPERVGADLVCGAAAAFYKYKKAVIVFDLGTATTVCAVNSRGEYLGHSIYPGIRTSFDALCKSAEQLPEIDDNYRITDVIGKNTVASVKSGVLYGAACFIDGMSKRYQSEIGEEAENIVTGGLGEAVLPLCSGKYIYEENLVPDGLRIIYNLNKELW